MQERDYDKELIDLCQKIESVVGKDQISKIKDIVDTDTSYSNTVEYEITYTKIE